MKLPYIKESELLEIHRRRLADRDPEVRMKAVWALVRIGTPGAVRVLAEALWESPFWDVQDAAAAALLHIGTPEAIDELRKAAWEHPDPAVQEAAAEILGGLDDEGDGEEEDGDDDDEEGG